jgi:hypothetical protein
VVLSLGAVAAVALLVALGLRGARHRMAAPIATGAFAMGAPAALLAVALQEHWMDGRAADRALPLIVIGLLGAGLLPFGIVLRARR